MYSLCVTSWGARRCLGKSVKFLGILDCGDRPAVGAFMSRCLRIPVCLYIASVNNSVSLRLVIYGMKMCQNVPCL